ncbi:hypothetical protein GCM10027360_40720 [Amycolatopsis echigonensis]
MVDRIGENYTADDTLQELIDPYADLERASLAVFDGDEMVGYLKIRYKPFAEEVHRVLLDGGVHPAYRRRGIGTTLVKAGIDAAKTLHAVHHPALKLVVDVHKAEHIAGVPDLVRSQGFAPARYFQRMEHLLGGGAPAIPRGFQLEQRTAGTDEDFRFVRNESFVDHWGAPPLPADARQNKFTNHTLQPEISFLLRDKETGAPVSLVLTLSWEPTPRRPAFATRTSWWSARFPATGTADSPARRSVPRCVPPPSTGTTKPAWSSIRRTPLARRGFSRGPGSPRRCATCGGRSKPEVSTVDPRRVEGPVPVKRYRPVQRSAGGLG